MNKKDNSTISTIELKEIYKLKIMLSIIGVGLIISILIAYCIINKFRHKDATKSSIIWSSTFLSITIFMIFIVGFDVGIHDAENVYPTMNFKTQKKIIQWLYDIINYFSLAFSFVIFPLFQVYHLSGYETFRDKVLYVVLDNLKSKIKFLVIGVIAIAILFAIYQENIIKETTNLFKIVRIYLNFFNLLKFYFNASYGVFQTFFDILIYFRCDLLYAHIFYLWKIKEISNQYLECKVKLVTI